MPGEVSLDPGQGGPLLSLELGIFDHPSLQPCLRNEGPVCVAEDEEAHHPHAVGSLESSTVLRNGPLLLLRDFLTQILTLKNKFLGPRLWHFEETELERGSCSRSVDQSGLGNGFPEGRGRSS